MMIAHPRFRRLARYAVAGSTSPSLTRHLARCTRCRGVVADLRRISAEARQAPAPPHDPDALTRILARRAAGERVLLPVDPTRTPSLGRAPRRLVGAAAAAVLAICAALLVPRADVDAGSSELAFQPAAPRPGQVVRVEYRPTGALAGRDSLVLRARVRDTATYRELPAILVRTVAVLRPARGGVYRGEVRFPAAGAYAVFAVESADGRVADDHGQAWELMAHDAAGRPTLAALRQRFEDARERDVSLALRTLTRAAELYPDDPEAVGQAMWFDAPAEAGTARADSVRRQYRARFDALQARLAGRTVGERQAWMMGAFAAQVGDTAAARAWRLRVASEHPNGVWGFNLRLAEAAAQGVAEYLRVAEEAWRAEGADPAVDPGRRATLAWSAFVRLMEADAPAPDVERWARRAVQGEPLSGAAVASALMERDDTRPQGIALAEREVAWRDLARPERRLVGETVADQRGRYRREQADLLASAGNALIKLGRRADGLAMLQRASRLAWKPALFRDLAAARLRAGDTAAAVEAFARVAADPATPAAYADSVRTRVGPAWRGDAWARSLAAARAEMRRRVMEGVVSRPVRAAARVQTLDGRPATLGVRSGGVTVVAVWLRWCPMSQADFPALVRASRRLASHGVRVVAVTPEARSPELVRAVRASGAGFPVLVDAERQAARALQVWAFPTYLVLDAGGRIRFESHTAEEAERQAEVLRSLR